MTTHLAATAALFATACLDPLVDDAPGASAHLLPPGTVVPSVLDNPELTNQLVLNDGLDDEAVGPEGGVIRRATGQSAGSEVFYWSFGPASRAPAPLYEFYRDTENGRVRIPHPVLVDALPGDPGYRALRTIQHVVVTPAYRDEIMATVEALADAIDLGLVREPVPTGNFVHASIVVPGTRLEVAATPPDSDTALASPEVVYGRGYRAAIFQFGGALGVQPVSMLLPTRQVSFLRDFQAGSYGSTPIFQATIPTAPPDRGATYTPLSVVVEVDLAPLVPASTIVSDSDLFVRSAGGAITSTTDNVVRFEVTEAIELLQLQFVMGAP